jgi:hypothetical protein
VVDKLTCDVCNSEMEVVETRQVSPLKTCEHLGCGHWWHISLSRLGSGDAATYVKCDCPDCVRPAVKHVAL